jgi:hypothetical protein
MYLPCISYHTKHFIILHVLSQSSQQPCEEGIVSTYRDKTDALAGAMLWPGSLLCLVFFNHVVYCLLCKLIPYEGFNYRDPPNKIN